jgi:hypothetical protein
MTHLVLHVVEQLDLLGPSHVGWMFVLEILNEVFKSYARNMSTQQLHISI